MAPRGVLVVRRGAVGSGPVREEQLPFSDLQELLDLCAAHTQGAAFVQVQVSGESGGEGHRLVLDFGQFGRDAG